MSRINAAFLRALDLNADPVSGGQAFVYNAGTTDPVRTYSDVQLTSVQASPVVADAAGNFPDIYAASGSYKVVIQDAEGVTLYEADNVDIGGSSLVGSISPEDYTARGDGTGDDTDAMREFFAALPGRVGDLTPGATYVINSKLSIPGGDFTLNANGATLDFSGISNDDGDVAGALLAVSGAEQSTNQIITITTATTAFGLITTTVTMNDEHGLSVGDEVLVSSDDIIDTGHNDANERRGQFMRVEELQGAFSFKSTQKLYETLPTNPVLTPISWAENIHIDGILRIKGPGRRPTEAGFIGLSFKYVRDVNIGDLVTEDVDYQVLSRDNCLRAHAGNLTFRFPPQGASTAVQYGDTFKNASTDCSTLSITSYGGKHPFDWTRNTTPGIGRHTRIGHILAYDTWDSVVATHGNSRDLNFTSVKGLNCLYVFGSRVADVRVDDIYGENCYEVLKITDDTRNLSVGSVRGKNVSFVVRAKDTPTTSNEGWIGSLESRNINIESVQGLDVTNNTIFLDWSDIPVFTEADAAVTGGSATTILLGAFPAPADFDVNQYNFSGALTGSEIAMDWDGAGGGTVQTRTITGHTYAGGVNTLTVSGWTNNPVAGTSTYTIRSFVDDINIGRVISKNCVGSDVFVTGNLRRLVIGDMDVISETNLATAAVLIQGTANTYPDGVAFGAIRRFQKTAPVVSSFAQNVKFEASVTDPLILSADPTVDLGAATKQYVDRRGLVLNFIDQGAVGNGVADDTTAFEDTLTLAAAQVVGDGRVWIDGLGKTYKLTNKMTWPSGVCLRNAKIDATTAATASSSIEQLFDARGTVSADYPLTANATAANGPTQVIVMDSGDAANLSAGDLIRVRSEEYWNTVTNNCFVGEMNVVRSVSGGNVTLQWPLLYNYTTANVSTVSKITPTKNITFQNVQAVGPVDDTLTDQALKLGFLSFYFGHNCRVLDCDLRGFNRGGVEFRWTLNGWVKRSTFTNFIEYYGISAFNGAMNLYISENHFVNTRHAVSGGGSNTFGGGIVNFVFVHNNVSTGRDADYDAHDPCDNWTFSNNVATSGGSVSSPIGITYQGRNVTITGNTVTGYSKTGIFIQPYYTAPYPATIVVSGNLVDGNDVAASSTGIYVFAGEQANMTAPKSIAITGNTVSGPYVTGISVLTNCNDNLSAVSVSGNNTSVGTFGAAPATGITLRANGTGDLFGFSVSGGVVQATTSCILLHGDVRGGVISGVHMMDATTGVNGSNDANSQNVKFGMNSFSGVTTPFDTGLISHVISSGSISLRATGNLVVVDTEAAAATDTLDTIEGGTRGEIITLQSLISSRDVTVAHGTAANGIRLVGAANFVMGDTFAQITIRYDGTRWLEISRSLPS